MKMVFAHVVYANDCKNLMFRHNVKKITHFGNERPMYLTKYYFQKSIENFDHKSEPLFFFPQAEYSSKSDFS